MTTMSAPRWRGQPGRLEVWYSTLTDGATGTGFWLHHELVAPLQGEPHAHGWVAAFPLDGPPAVERFGPAPVSPGGTGFDAADVRADDRRLHGAAGSAEWDLSVRSDGPPLFTFPRRVWESELLPAAQVVPQPTASYDGSLRLGGRSWQLSGARGASARIFGHGNAKRWGWLHADLGDGDVLEIVTAVSRRPGLSALPPLAFVQLRHDGVDWPANPLAAAPLFRTRLDGPLWSVSGVVGRRRLRVEVRQDPARTLRVGYVDPDGATASCFNSEVATCLVRLDRWRGGWRTEHEWDVPAHAEVGTRP